MSDMPDNGQIFFWKVRSWNALGWSNWSPTWSVTNGPSAPPVTPTLSAPANQANVAGDQVILWWNPTQRAYQYRLQLAWDSGFNDMAADTQLSYDYSGLNVGGLLDNGEQLFWRISASNSLGSSSWSPTWKFTNGPSYIPLPPVLLQPAAGSNVAGGNVLFRWGAVERGLSYAFQLASDPGFANIAFETTQDYLTGVNLSNFPDNGTTFSWRVRAGNALGNFAKLEERVAPRLSMEL
jgi:hypothetical protein